MLLCSPCRVREHAGECAATGTGLVHLWNLGRKRRGRQSAVAQMQRGHLENFKRLFGEKKLAPGCCAILPAPRAALSLSRSAGSRRWNPIFSPTNSCATVW